MLDPPGGAILATAAHEAKSPAEALAGPQLHIPGRRPVACLQKNKALYAQTDKQQMRLMIEAEAARQSPSRSSRVLPSTAFPSGFSLAEPRSDAHSFVISHDHVGFWTRRWPVAGGLS